MRAHQFQEASSPVGPVIPPRDKSKLVGNTVYLPQEFWDRIARVIEATKASDPFGKGYKRTEVVMHLISWALDQFEAEQAKAKKKR